MIAIPDRFLGMISLDFDTKVMSHVVSFSNKSGKRKDFRIERIAQFEGKTLEFRGKSHSVK